MVPTNSSIILATPNLSLGPTRTEERNSSTRASTSGGRSHSDGGMGQGAGKLVNGGEGAARSALRLQEGMNQHEAPGDVVDGGARRTSVGTVVTHVGRQWQGLSMTRDVVDRAGSETAVARHKPDLHDPLGTRKSS